MTTEACPRVMNLDDLNKRIVEEYDNLSGRLRQVGDFFIQHPDMVALETLVAIAREIDVSPSTLVRFANYFGFNGFSELQQLYRSQLKGRMEGYRERVRHADTDLQGDSSGHSLLKSFAHPQAMAIESLATLINPGQFKKALDLMEQAETIYIHGVRRAFPVACYLSYALMRADVDVVLLDGVGGLHKNQLKRISEKDLLLAVTYHPHADETAETIRSAHEKHARVVALTDHNIHPCSRLVDVSLRVSEAEMMGIRSLGSSMHLAQCLVMSLLCHQEQ